MPLYVLIGNTNVKISGRAGQLLCVSVTSSVADLKSALLSHGTGPVIAASVNPRANTLLENACRDAKLPVPLYAGRDFPVGVTLLVDQPSAVGIDRILNVKAAFARCRAACAAVDLGTAISISIADGRGAFVGGAILPGIGLSLRSLRENTALLPAVEAGAPLSALGKDTVAAMRSGCIFGALGAVKEIVARSSAAVGAGLTVFLTGGDAALLEPYLPEGWAVVPGLTIDGLRLAYDESR